MVEYSLLRGKNVFSPSCRNFRLDNNTISWNFLIHFKIWRVFYYFFFKLYNIAELYSY
jgi:hypothetical protein